MMNITIKLLFLTMMFTILYSMENEIGEIQFALNEATDNGNFLEAVKELIKNTLKKNLNQWNDEETALMRAALFMAADSNDIEMLKELINGFDEIHKKELFEYLNVQDECGKTALMRAAYLSYHDHSESVNELINAFDENHKTELIQYLNAKDQDESTALMIAAENNHSKSVKELIHAFDENHKKELIEYLNVQNQYGLTALMRAAELDQTKIIKQLINAFDENHKTELIQYLNVQNEYGATALMIAAEKNFSKSVKELIHAFDESHKKELIEYLHVQNQYGKNALMIAAATYRIDAVIYRAESHIESLKELINAFDENHKKELIEYLDVQNDVQETALSICANEYNPKGIVAEDIKFIAKAFGVQKINAPMIILNIKKIPLKIQNKQANALISSIMFLCMVNSKSNRDSQPIFAKQHLLARIVFYLVGPHDFDLISTLFPAYKMPALK